MHPHLVLWHRISAVRARLLSRSGNSCGDWLWGVNQPQLHPRRSWLLLAPYLQYGCARCGCARCGCARSGKGLQLVGLDPGANLTCFLCSHVDIIEQKDSQWDTGSRQAARICTLTLSNGAAGPTGAAGARGATGPAGAAGSAGSNGAAGAGGARGATGPAGAGGSRGVGGATGPQGAAGSRGAVGPTGGVGPTGTPGTPASTSRLDAHDVALDELRAQLDVLLQTGSPTTSQTTTPTTSQTTTAAGDRAASSAATDADGGDGLAAAALGLACVSLVAVAVLAAQNRRLSQQLRSLVVQRSESRASGSAPGIGHLGLISVRDADGQEGTLPRPLQAVASLAAVTVPPLANERDRGPVARAVANPSYTAILTGCDGPGGCTATADDGANIYAVPLEGNGCSTTHTPNQMYASATPMMVGAPGSDALYGSPQPLGGGGGGGGDDDGNDDDDDRCGYLDVSGSEVDIALGERLCDAVEEGDVEALKAVLLEPGANVNAVSDGTFPLFLASVAGHTEVARMLLQAGANPNQLSGGNGKTPLLKAAVRGHTEVVRVLLDGGAVDIEKTTDRASALFAASYTGSLDAMRLLIDHGSDLENRLAAAPLQQPSDAKYIGSTPLIIASFFDQPAAIEMLLAAGADRAAKTNEGRTAKDVAASEACRLLLD